MKKNALFLIASLLLFIATAATGQSNQATNLSGIQASLQVQDDVNVELNVQNTTGKKLRLRLIARETYAFGGNGGRLVVYDEQFEAGATSFSRLLNLGKLDNGFYEVELKAGKQRWTRRFEIRSKRDLEPVNPRSISLR